MVAHRGHATYIFISRNKKNSLSRYKSKLSHNNSQFIAQQFEFIERYIENYRAIIIAQ